MKLGRAIVLVTGILVAGCSGRRCAGDQPFVASNAQYVIPKATSTVVNLQSGIEDASTPKVLKQGTEEFTWTFDQTSFGRIDVVVVLPDRLPGEKFPLLIALHGRGEAMKGSVRGSRGWVDDYALGRAIRRLAMPPLERQDFEGIVDSERLNLINRELDRQPYRGLVVLCPYTPDILAGERPFDRALPYGRFLVETLLARARRELPVIPSAAATGIDGVSLGGRVALLSGLYQPESFGAVGTLQAAFDSSDAGRLATMATKARRANPGLKFRFLTSDNDYFLRANQAISAAFTQLRIDHQFLVVPGPHDYIFNRGPGVIEMLFYHDRVLREPPLH